MNLLTRIIFASLLLALIPGCPDREIVVDNSISMHDVASCNILYDNHNHTWIRSIQPAQSGRFILCDEEGPLLEGDDVEYHTTCNVSNNVIVEGYENEPQRFELLEEYCVDDEISGRCETWNCQDVHDMIDPETGWGYPKGCLAYKTRHSGLCEVMWYDDIE